VSYPPVKAGHLLIDGATLASVDRQKAFCFFLQRKMSMMAHRVISLPRGNSVAFGAKQTWAEL
jgi:hypothetical protein